ncbi:unnamed protein product [Brassicogethes aeneus]|uniref:DNA-directed RNA polymerase III subunit n=1 Tax=Brassicogethes aeneus TaxID=1431903 RepID=A0A9P0AZL7_BRAAE|nr:unnamed protein product [Brassicogethes aeneus]
MSRGRGARGGGRGGVTKSFNREQLNALGVGGNDMLPGLVTQPPPLFPLLDKRPVPIHISLELDYLLILKQDFIDHMQLSGSYLKLPETKSNESEIVPQVPKEKYDWSLFPSELRPKMMARRAKKVVVKDVDVNNRLKLLETLEEKQSADTTIKQEKESEDVDETEIVEEDQDEEMDDGTDYANNYFDNGEDYEEEDDNLDDGPIY